MAVTKRTRYEVLRRDNHTCRYCGSSAAMRRAAEVEAQRLEDAEQLLDYFEAEWAGRMPHFAELPDFAEWSQSVTQFYSMGLIVPLLDDAITIAARADHVAQRLRWKFFCGVCWNKVRDLQRAAQQIALAEEG